MKDSSAHDFEPDDNPDSTPSRSENAFTADELEGARIPRRLWQYPGLIPANTVTLLTGDGGVGKSTLALQACVSTVLGTPWIGHEPREGNALYLSAEDDRDELHRRVADIGTFYGRPLAMMAGLKLWPLVDGEAVLATAAPHGDHIVPTPLWFELLRLAIEWEPKLLVLDASADVFAINENSRPQVRQAIGLLRSLAIRTGSAVTLLAHPSLQGLTSGSGFSGSTAWNNSVRSRLYLSRPKSDDGGEAAPDIRTLGLMKANYAPSGSEFRLLLRGGAFTNEDAAAGAPLSRIMADSRVEGQFLELLAAYEAQGRPVSHTPSANYAPSLFAKDPRAQGTTKKGFEASMGRLFADGRIAVVVDGPPSRRRSKIVKA
jgi:RecA-family ATPase